MSDIARYRITQAAFDNPFTGERHIAGSENDIIEMPTSAPRLTYEQCLAKGLEFGSVDKEDRRHEPNIYWTPLNVAARDAIKAVIAQKRAAKKEWERRVKEAGGDADARERVAGEMLAEANKNTQDLDTLETALDESLKIQQRLEAEAAEKAKESAEGAAPKATPSNFGVNDPRVKRKPGRAADQSVIPE